MTQNHPGEDLQAVKEAIVTRLSKAGHAGARLSIVRAGNTRSISRPVILVEYPGGDTPVDLDVSLRQSLTVLAELLFERLWQKHPQYLTRVYGKQGGEVTIVYNEYNTPIQEFRVYAGQYQIVYAPEYEVTI